jgi:hypothetical protein
MVDSDQMCQVGVLTVLGALAELSSRSFRSPVVHESLNTCIEIANSTLFSPPDLGLEGCVETKRVWAAVEDALCMELVLFGISCHAVNVSTLGSKDTIS